MKNLELKTPTRRLNPEKQLAYIRKQVIDYIMSGVNQTLMPMLGKTKTQWADDYSDMMGDFFDQMLSVFETKEFKNRLESVLAQPIGMMGDIADKDLVGKLKQKQVGIDYKKLFKQKKLKTVYTNTINENVKLIKSMASEHLGGVQTIVTNGVQNGQSLNNMAKEIQKKTKATRKRSRFVARDQYSKTLEAVERQRSKDIGLERYKWLTSGTNRVSGDPNGLYPNAKIKCYMIAKRDIGMGEGVYTYKDGAEWAGEKKLHAGSAHIGCMCTKVPLLAGIDY
jgi:SPP1 gp7 family putative phage head morphogenesis protein